MHLRKKLENFFGPTFSELSGNFEVGPQIKPSSRPEFGDFQVNGVLPLAKLLGKNPRALADEVMNRLSQRSFATKLEVAGPGFINIFLDDLWIIEKIKEKFESKNLDIEHSLERKHFVVDLSGPNLAKEMHVGHLRTTIIGDSIAKILEFFGHKVTRQNHVGDYGTQFGMLIEHFIRSQTRVSAETGSKSSGNADASSDLFLLSDLEVFYVEAKKRFDNEPDFSEAAKKKVVGLQTGDPEIVSLWKKFVSISLDHCQAVYDKLGVNLAPSDVKAESSYGDMLPGVMTTLRNNNLIVEDGGAQCVFLEEFKDKEGKITPIIVQKSDGGFLYATTDLATLKYRSFDLQADEILYVIDGRQALHLQQVFALSKKAGLLREGCVPRHLPFGMVLGKDNKPFKTRSGGSPKLMELLEDAEKKAYDLVDLKNPSMDEEEKRFIAKKIGIAAIKYADLSKMRSGDYVFDLDSMISFEGNTAPYLIYAYARIKGILRKVGEVTSEAGGFDSNLTLEKSDRALGLAILKFDESLEFAAQEFYPHYICTYLYELSGKFMAFYESSSISQETNENLKNFRIVLCHLTAEIIKTGLDLLGIEVLEKM